MSFLNQVCGQVQTIYPEGKLDCLIGPISLTLAVPNVHQYQIGQNVKLFTHLVWREDAQFLYGFHSLEERTFFLKLLKIRTLGPKIALSILSFDRSRFITACRSKDKSELTLISGIGPKMALKIINEFDCDELQSLHEDITGDHYHDFKTALLQLGFSASDIYKSFGKIAGELSLENKIKEALQILGDTRVRS